MRYKSSLFLILLLASLSFGFIMEFEWPWMQKKESSAKPKPPAQATVAVPAVSTSPAKPENPVAPAEEAMPTPDANAEKTIFTTTAETRPDLEVMKIQEELQTIVSQTKVIQTQSQADRARLKNVLDQVQVQKRLIQTLKVQKPPAKPIAVNNVANTDEILRNTKIRLLAEEVQKTRTVLESIQPITKVQSESNKITKPVSVPKPQKTA